MNKKFLLPLIIAISIAAGFLLGTKYFNFGSQSNQYTSKIGTSIGKMDALMSLIDSKYVDTVDINNMVEKAIPDILKNLDPHTVYIPAKDREKADESINGSFSGIGVQFHLYEDTIRVVSVIHGGPSEKVGIMDGDKIVTINDSLFVGPKINNDKVMKTLRGEKGSKVKVGVKRYGLDTLVNFTITRGAIPVKSVEAKYMYNENVGYVKMTAFGRTTHSELMDAIAYLKMNGAKKLIIDLRSNTGGLLEAALNIANEFLPSNRLILYSQGKAYKRSDIYSNGSGVCQDMPLVFLIDEWSASASEILSGAMQDNDRAYIVGRRSFGKGLVQNEIPFKDGSAIRLTIARFYIPSGRSIQKPYTFGEDDKYEKDIYNRYKSGEFLHEDSIHFSDSLKYKTYGGRTVYGGGGIMPDYFVPLDTTHTTVWAAKVVASGSVSAYSFKILNEYKASLKKVKTDIDFDSWFSKNFSWADFVSFCRGKKFKDSVKNTNASRDYLTNIVKANLARTVLSNDDYWRIIEKDDKTLEKGVEVVEKAKNVVK